MTTAADLSITWVSHGEPAAEALRLAVGAAKGGDPLAPVTVVVPSNYVGVATRRRLASGALGPVADRGTGIAAVSFVTVYRLADLLGTARLALSGRRPVSIPVIAAALRAALAADPGMFAPVATHPATETALIAAYRELRDLSEGALDALARRSRRAGDVVRLHAAARGALAPAFYDEEDLLDAAVDAVHEGGPGAAALGGVVVFLPDNVTRHGGRLLGALAAARSEATGGGLVVLAGTTGEPRADGDVVRSLRRMQATLSAAPVANGARGGRARGGADRDVNTGAAVQGQLPLEGLQPPAEIQSVPEPPPLDPLHVVATGRTQIITASDSDEEVRAAVRQVVDAAREGVPLDRIAILHTSPVPYARLLHEQLGAADVTYNGAAVMPLAARVTGRTLLGLLDLPHNDFRREEVFAWLGGARLRHQGRSVPTAAWEDLSRQAGVVAGADWDRRLSRLAAELEERAAAMAAADPDASVARFERDATRARDLRAFVLGLMDELAQVAGAPRTWDAHVAWASRLLAELVGTERHRGHWPLVEQKAAERVERALDRLASLGALEGAIGLDVFTRTLEVELEADLGRVGRMGEGVLVGSVAMGVALDLDLVVVLGLAEGLCPSPTRDDSLLPDRERAATDDELPMRAHGVERQHRQLLAALAGARRQVLTVPRGDLRRNLERTPSRWVLQMAGVLAGGAVTSPALLDGQADWLMHLASFDAGIRRLASAEPATAQEHRLRALMVHGSHRLDLAALRAVGDARVAAGAAMVDARLSARFTRFDGNLSDLAEPVPSPVDRINSATRLEKWSDCPFAYLLRDVLFVEEVENPEDALEMTPRDVGNLVHEVLEAFIVAELAERADGSTDGLLPESELHTIAARVGNDYVERGLAGRPIFWRRTQRRVAADLHRFYQEEVSWRATHDARPLDAELKFGFADATTPAVTLALGDGREVPFRGFADRIDLAANGTLHVIDYKTGKADGYSDLSEDNPDARGRRLQLAVYGQAARARRNAPDAAVQAHYYFISKRGDFVRYGYPVTAEVLAQVGSSLAAVVDGIEHGVFPHHPDALSTSPFISCPYCDPDGLGVTELRRQFERKAVDPSMAPFITFAYGDETEAEADDAHLDDGEGSEPDADA